MPDPSVPIVSIVIPVRNESRAMADLNWPKGSRELILVDNASFDSSGTLLKKAGGGRAEGVGESRRGSYAVRNAETSIAGGEIPAFTDTDCRPERDWLVKGADILRRHGLDTVTGKVRQVSPARRTLFDIVDQSIYVQTSLFRKLSGEQGFQGSKSLPECGRERGHFRIAADADPEKMDLKAGDFLLPVGNQHGKRDRMRGVTDGIQLMRRIQGPGSLRKRFIEDRVHQQDRPAGHLPDPGHRVLDGRPDCMSLKSFAAERLDVFGQHVADRIVPTQRVADSQNQQRPDFQDFGERLHCE